MRWLKPNLWLLHLGVNDERAFVVPRSTPGTWRRSSRSCWANYKARPDSIFLARPATTISRTPRRCSSSTIARSTAWSAATICGRGPTFSPPMRRTARAGTARIRCTPMRRVYRTWRGCGAKRSARRGRKGLWMTGKERFMMTMRFQEPDRPPHFESMFELEQEAFGLKFPSRDGWNCPAAEKERRISTCLDIYERIVERYHWDALTVYWPWERSAGRRRGEEVVRGPHCRRGYGRRGNLGDRDITDWDTFAVDLMEHRERIPRRGRGALPRGHRKARPDGGGRGGLRLPAQRHCFNGGPFGFAEGLCGDRDGRTLERQIQHARKTGLIAIFHSDGMLMPVLDQILSCWPNALHSIDPMAGMDIAAVKT